MVMDEIFFPNKLTKSEIENLSGWKLKVACVHFGINRGDCVRFGYGHQLRKEYGDDKAQIYLVADRDGPIKPIISLEDEIDWNDSSVLLSEIGIEVSDIIKDYLKEKINDI